MSIDEHGCRAIGTPNPDAQRAWLILGDSVTFGVGVPAEDTFIGLLQESNPKIKVWATPVVGMNLDDYRSTAKRMLERQLTIERIFLFFCLNDIYSSENQDPLTQRPLPAGVERMLQALRARSRLYILLKGILLDRSKGFFEWDYQEYLAIEEEQAIEKRLVAMEEIASLASQAGCELQVILLPYEYQLRVGTPDVWKPQELLIDYLKGHDIRFIDTRDWFKHVAGESKDYFLFGDSMHLSRKGHLVIFENLTEILSVSDTAR